LDRASASPGRLLHPARVPLDAGGGLIATVLAARQPQRSAGAAADPWLEGHLDCPDAYLLPLVWGQQPLGVLLVDLRAADDGSGTFGPADAQVLAAIAQQAALAIGMMESRLRSAKARAVQEERARIARDIHDTVSQSLFGLVYTLDGCLKLLPDEPEAIGVELQWALRAAEDVRREVRQTIHDMWPDELSAEQFQADLARYAADVLEEADVTLAFDVRGDFSVLSPAARRSLYRIGQEALTNIAHHAAAREARVCFDVVDQRARLVIRDDGRGFEPQVALSGDYGAEHFGLRGIQARARSLGGSCDIFSLPGAGTSLVVELPAHARSVTGNGGAP
jgi:signal transduction histidine kinase